MSGRVSLTWWMCSSWAIFSAARANASSTAFSTSEGYINTQKGMHGIHTQTYAEAHIHKCMHNTCTTHAHTHYKNNNTFIYISLFQNSLQGASHKTSLITCLLCILQFDIVCDRQTNECMVYTHAYRACTHKHRENVMMTNVIDVSDI